MPLASFLLTVQWVPGAGEARQLWTQRRCHPVPENWVSTLQKALCRWDTLRTRRGRSAGLLGEETKPSQDPVGGGQSVGCKGRGDEGHRRWFQTLEGKQTPHGSLQEEADWPNLQFRAWLPPSPQVSPSAMTCNPLAQTTSDIETPTLPKRREARPHLTNDRDT